MSTLNSDALKSLKHDWQAGLLSLRLLAIRYGITAEQIADLAAEHHWGEQGRLRDAIDRAATSALVDRAVSENDRLEKLNDQSNGHHQVFLNDGEQIDRYAQIVAGVIETQRGDIGRGRALAGKMLAELEALEPPEVDQNAIESLANAVAEHQPELAEQLRRNIGPQTFAERVAFLQRRIGMLGALSGTQETYIGLEREAWGLNARVAPGANTGADDLIDLARKEQIEDQR